MCVALQDENLLSTILDMGQNATKFLAPHLWREDEPDTWEDIKYNPQFGFDKERKAKGNYDHLLDQDYYLSVILLTISLNLSPCYSGETYRRRNGFDKYGVGT